MRKRAKFAAASPASGDARPSALEGYIVNSELRGITKLPARTHARTHAVTRVSVLSWTDGRKTGNEMCFEPAARLAEMTSNLLKD